MPKSQPKAKLRTNEDALKKPTPKVKANLPKTPQVEGKIVPKTIKLWRKSAFSDKGAYVDVPIIRRVDDVTLYQ